MSGTPRDVTIHMITPVAKAYTTRLGPHDRSTIGRHTSMAAAPGSDGTENILRLIFHAVKA